MFCKLFEASEKTGKNVKEPFYYVTKRELGYKLDEKIKSSSLEGSFNVCLFGNEKKNELKELCQQYVFGEFESNFSNEEEFVKIIEVKMKMFHTSLSYGYEYDFTRIQGFSFSTSIKPNSLSKINDMYEILKENVSSGKTMKRENW